MNLSCNMGAVALTLCEQFPHERFAKGLLEGGGLQQKQHQTSVEAAAAGSSMTHEELMGTSRRLNALLKRTLRTCMHGTELLSAARCLSLGKNLEQEVDVSQLSKRKMLRVLKHDGQIFKLKNPPQAIGNPLRECDTHRTRQKRWATQTRNGTSASEPGRRNYTNTDQNPIHSQCLWKGMKPAKKTVRAAKQFINVGSYEIDCLRCSGRGDFPDETIMRILASKRAWNPDQRLRYKFHY